MSNTITAVVEIEVTNEKRNYAKGEAHTLLNTISQIKKVSFPTAGVMIDLNDASFVAVLVENYCADNNFYNEHLAELIARLTPKAGC